MSGAVARHQTVSRLEALRAEYGHLDAAELLRATIAAFPGEVAAISSFGAEAAVLLDLVAQADASVPVLFVDTDALFDETIAYREKLTRRLGLTDIRIVRPQLADIQATEETWHSDPDNCCRLRKVLPLRRATAGFNALIDGRKGFHGGQRSGLDTLSEGPDGTIRISPLVRWSAEEIERHLAERDLPRHPLVAMGYRSIGCWPCTRAVAPGEDPRAGRWAGRAKNECGIHTYVDAGAGI